MLMSGPIDAVRRRRGGIVQVNRTGSGTGRFSEGFLKFEQGGWGGVGWEELHEQGKEYGSG